MGTMKISAVCAIVSFLGLLLAQTASAASDPAATPGGRFRKVFRSTTYKAGTTVPRPSYEPPYTLTKEAGWVEVVSVIIPEDGLWTFRAFARNPLNNVYGKTWDIGLHVHSIAVNLIPGPGPESVLAGNNDWGGVPWISQVSVNVTAGHYAVQVSGNTPDDFGDYLLLARGPGEMRATSATFSYSSTTARKPKLSMPALRVPVGMNASLSRVFYRVKKVVPGGSGNYIVLTYDGVFKRDKSFSIGYVAIYSKYPNTTSAASLQANLVAQSFPNPANAPPSAGIPSGGVFQVTIAQNLVGGQEYFILAAGYAPGKAGRFRSLIYSPGDEGLWFP